MPPIPFRIKRKISNINDEEKKNKLFLEFKYEKHNNYKTPRMILINNNYKSTINNNIKNKKENMNNKIKRYLSDKIINRLTLDTFECIKEPIVIEDEKKK